MARVKYGPIVSDAAGKVAGSIFSHWKGIQYAKRFAKPGNPNTTAQQTVRTAFKRLTVCWKLMLSELVLQWTNYTKGKPYANRNAFIGQGMKDADKPLQFRLTPHNPDVFTLATFTVLPGATKVTCTWSWPNTTAGQKCRLYWKDTGSDVAITFDSEQTYPTVTKDITGLITGHSYVAWGIRLDGVLTTYSEDKHAKATAT